MKLFEKIVNIIFPKKCLGCGKNGTFVCLECIKKLKTLYPQVCYFCKTESERGETCSKCKKGKFLDGIFIGYFYDDLMRKLIHKFKYEFFEDVGKEIGEKFGEDLKESFYLGSNFFICPVPIHKKRYNFRGFNQAEILARKISEALFVEFFDPIERVKNTKPQVELKREERINNVKNAFSIKKEFIGKLREKIILVDDVVTTGSTLEECARVLKENGAKKVFAVVLAGHN